MFWNIEINSTTRNHSNNTKTRLLIDFQPKSADFVSEVDFIDCFVECVGLCHSCCKCFQDSKGFKKHVFPDASVLRIFPTPKHDELAREADISRKNDVSEPRIWNQIGNRLPIQFFPAPRKTLFQLKMKFERNWVKTQEAYTFTKSGHDWIFSIALSRVDCMNRDQNEIGCFSNYFRQPGR